MSTASPRDIIAAELSTWCVGRDRDREAIGDAILSALTAAGYRVVREGELDAATVERCANHLDVLAEAHHDRAAYRTKGGKYHTLFTERGEGLSEGADALRALVGWVPKGGEHGADKIIAALTAAGWTLAPPGKFKRGDRVTKISGSSWTGRVVGTYSTTLTPEGYAVESENEPGSVQIYPVSALRSADD